MGTLESRVLAIAGQGSSFAGAGSGWKAGQCSAPVANQACSLAARRVQRCTAMGERNRHVAMQEILE